MSFKKIATLCDSLSLLLLFLSACNTPPETNLGNPIKEPLELNTPKTTIKEEVPVVPFILDTILEFDAAQLTLKPADSVYIEEYFLKNHQIDSFTKIYSNYEERALAIEKMVVKKVPGYIKRKDNPEQLSVKLKNGEWCLMTLNPNSDNAGHEYEHYFKEFGYYSIRVQCSEGNFYKLVNDSNGKVTELFGRPYFSPNGKFIVSVSEDLVANYCRNGLQFFRSENGKLILAGKIEPTLWGPFSVKWISENKFVMKCSRLKNPNTFETVNFYTEVTIKE